MASAESEEGGTDEEEKKYKMEKRKLDKTCKYSWIVPMRTIAWQFIFHKLFCVSIIGNALLNFMSCWSSFTLSV